MAGVEVILRSMAASTKAEHTDEFKRQMLHKILANTAATVPASEVSSLLSLFVEWSLVSDSKMLNSTGFRLFTELAESRPEEYRAHVTPNLVLDLLSSSVYTSGDRGDLVRLVAEMIRLLKAASPGAAGPGEHLRSVYNVTRNKVYAFLADHGVQLSVAVAVSRLYSEHPEVLPHRDKWTEFTLLVVKLMAGYGTPASGPGDREAFGADAQEVSRMLPLIWGRSVDTQGVQECLTAFYAIITTEDDSFNKPSCALLHVVDKIPDAFLRSASRTMLDDSGQPQFEAKTVVGLQNLLEWLTQLPAPPVASRWALDMLRGLQESDRNSILIEIAHTATKRLAGCLADRALSPAVEPVFFFLLLGFQHSELVFHSIVSTLPAVLGDLKATGKWGERLLLRTGEAAAFLMTRFPHFPDLYDKTRDALEAAGIEDVSEDRVAELKSLSWLSPLHSTTFMNSGEAASSLPTLKRKRPKNSPIDEAISLRSETGMVGLINLGNTCYMNSVLQALFVTKDFCDLVLSAPVTAAQPVLLRLQTSFSFLRYSQRSIYSPNEFLKSSRPPWFEPGRQQDCCEFLRYLLDTLHEQEKAGRQGQQQGAVVTYGEHRLIESNPTPSTPAAAAADESASSTNLLFSSPPPSSSSSPATSQGSTLLSVSAKMKSASSGLDVIAEEDNGGDDDGAQVVPSMVVTGGGGEIEDECEVMSQDDDCFGSQGSLGGAGLGVKGGGAHSEEDDEDAMDIEAAAAGGLSGLGGNLGGSRNRSVYSVACDCGSYLFSPRWMPFSSRILCFN